jgi:hypothetical protein
MAQNGSAGGAKDNLDRAVPAILRHANRFWPCPSLEDAVVAWHKLPLEMRESASIEVDDAVYRAREIEKLANTLMPESKPAVKRKGEED